ncbi:MAG: hypothetical protein LBO09_06725 [Candidatus Peribacteria bacterium]|jgi:hypothetical protein|nr:hypothetical protein [Candidatus Peribacteria bacterium]
MPAFSDSNVNTFIKQIQDAKGPTRVETAIERFNTAGVMVGNKRVSYAEYVAYNRQQNKNY